MPQWVIDLITNAGPVAGIMGFMWWLERKERVAYQGKYEQLLLTLPDKITGFVDEQRKSNEQQIESYKKLTRSVWAAIRKTENPRRRFTPGDMPAIRSLPPAHDDEGSDDR